MEITLKIVYVIIFALSLFLIAMNIDGKLFFHSFQIYLFTMFTKAYLGPEPQGIENYFCQAEKKVSSNL